jgi:cbb3-type cytochrome oxidase cytochrome c subunit
MAAVPKKEDAPDAPDLTEVGLKHSTAWLHSYIEDPVRFHPDSKMPAYGPPTLSHQEIEELARYLASLRGPPALNKQPEFRDTFPEPLKAKENK